MTAPYTFAELVDLAALKQMLASLYELAQIPVAIVDLEGNLLAAAGWERICPHLHPQEPGVETSCLARAIRLREGFANGQCLARNHCPHGLFDRLAPIVVEGEHQANAVTGQLLLAPSADRQSLREQGREYGFNPEEYLAAMAALPVLPAERHHAILELLTRLSQQLAEIGLNNRRIRESPAQNRPDPEKSRIENQLRQAQKMEAIGTLAGGIAHDFNNILTAILGYTEMAKSEVEKDSTIANDLQEVLKAGNRAKNLVTQILAFSRQAAVEPIPLQLPSMIKEAVKLLRSSLPSTIAIETKIEPAMAPIMADPTQINQLLMNLSTNAFHAMEKTGGRLEIGLHEVTLLPEQLLHQPEVKPGPFLKLSVSDTGPGIAPEIKERIFDPYFTTKEMGKGTGLGLAIVHGIAKNYGGFVQLANNPGGGASFQVYFPVFRRPEELEVEMSGEIPGGSESIFMIDDEEVITRLGKEMLEKLGYRVTVANDSLEALATFRQDPSQFDLVITDQTMPGLTGAELTSQLLQLRPELPVILCTGYSTIIEEEAAHALGVREFALKPVSKRELATLVRKALKKI